MLRGTAAPAARGRGASSTGAPRGHVSADAQERRTRPGAGDAAAAARVETESRARRGAKTDNDGQADRPLRAGGFSGERDHRIAELKQRQRELQAQRDRTVDEVTELDREVARDSKVAGVVGVAANVVLPGVGIVSGLLGRKNPAREAAEKLLDVDEDRSRLVDRERRLGAQEARIADELQRLQEERTLNFLSDVSHVTNMPGAVTAVLDGAAGPKISVAESTGLGSDAAYSSGDRSIVVDRAVTEKVRGDLEELRRSGVVDEDGNILDPKKFDRSRAGDSAISSAALIGVHEVTHGAQDSRGEIGAAAGVATGAEAGKPHVHAHGDDHHGPAARPAGRAPVDAERQRVDAIEYDAYVNQETIELQAGKQKQGFVTINPDGSLLPRGQAVDNIVNFQLGLPLAHGVSAGKSFSGVVAGASGSGDDQERPGRRSPGSDVPGRRSPGSDAPGRRSPGDDAPGRRSPGDDAPGRRSPGDDAPGRRSPGSDAPGRRSPGDDAPGRRSPGFDAPGRRSPGSDAPGRRSPGSIIG